MVTASDAGRFNVPTIAKFVSGRKGTVSALCRHVGDPVNFKAVTVVNFEDSQPQEFILCLPTTSPQSHKLFNCKDIEEAKEWAERHVSEVLKVPGKLRWA